MAVRPHGADEPREGPIDEPLDQGGPEGTQGDPGVAPARADEPDVPDPAGPTRAGRDADRDSAPERPDERAGDGPPRDVGGEPGAETPTDDGAPDDVRDPDAVDGPEAARDAGEPAGSTSGAPAGRPRDEPDDVDARWQEIIAQLGDLDAGTAGRPEAEAGTGTEQDAAAPRPPADEPVPARTVRPAAPASAHRAWAPDPAVEEAEDHFEPPDPGPVLGGDPLLTMAWTVVVGVPVLFIAAVVLWRDIPTVVLRVAAGAFVAGVGLLLWRMPHRRDEDDGPGAVV